MKIQFSINFSTWIMMILGLMKLVIKSIFIFEAQDQSGSNGFQRSESGNFSKSRNRKRSFFNFRGMYQVLILLSLKTKRKNSDQPSLEKIKKSINTVFKRILSFIIFRVSRIFNFSYQILIHKKSFQNSVFLLKIGAPTYG
jgi:hypothetical protein